MVCAKVVGGRQGEEQLGDRDPVELRADRLAHDAADAVGPDQERTAGAFRSPPSGSVHVERDAIGVLPRIDGPGPEPNGRERALLQAREQHLAEPPLLALQAIRMAGIGGKPRQLERRDDAFVAVAELPGRTDQSLLDHRLDDAETLQHVERRRMKRRSAQVARQISEASTSVTGMPASASRFAVTSPTGPAPTMITCCRFSLRIEFLDSRAALVMNILSGQR